MSLVSFYPWKEWREQRKLIDADRDRIGSVRVLPRGFPVQRVGEWMFRDSAKSLTRDLGGLMYGDKICALRSDGTLFIQSKADGLFVVDPLEGDRHPFEIDRSAGELRVPNVHFRGSDNPNRVPIDGGTPLLAALEGPVLSGAGGESGLAPPRQPSLARIDLRKRTISPTEPPVGIAPVFVQSDGTEATLIVSHTQLIRYHLDTNERSVLCDTTKR